MLRWFTIAFCLVSCLGAQEPDELLDKIRSRVAESAKRLPNYLCTETVERQVFVLEQKAPCEDLIKTADQPSHAAQLVMTDRLRLDVALSSKGEMYSWVGEGRFDDRDLSEIVNYGTTSTGAFGSFLRAIFASHDAEFTFKEKKQVDDRTVLQYDFAVPVRRSGYVVNNLGLTRTTGYTGSFTADAETLDLLSMKIKTDPLPTELGVCRSTNDIRYAKLRLNEADVFVPAEVTVDMLAADGHSNHNNTEFRSCHQFMGESKITFDETPSESNAGKTSATKPVSRDVPSDLKVTVALAQEIDPARAAAGDSITGSLTRKIKKPGFQVAKGAKLRGRILAVRRYYQNGRVLELGIRWETIDVGGVEQAIRLVRPSAGENWRNDQDFLEIPVISDYYTVPAGFETTWLTMERPQ